MVMKFGRAYCEQLGETLSPYQARELYTDEDGDHYGQVLNFLCEDENCRSNLTPVGIYMTRKSKRALHFRTKDEHKIGCDFIEVDCADGRSRRPSLHEDDYKLSNFPSEFNLNPPKRKASGGASTIDNDDGPGSTGGRAGGSGGGIRRKTNSKTRYLDLVVDCFLSGDDESKKGLFTIEEKTKPFYRFFKKVEYFGDEVGLIYYGAIDKLELYPGIGVGIRFAKRAKVDDSYFRIWANISLIKIDQSRRKKAFMTEITELRKALVENEEVLAFFVGAYPMKKAITLREGDTFDIYEAELSSIDHLSLAFP